MDMPHSDTAIVMSTLASPAARPGRLLSLLQAQARLGTQHLSTQLPRGGAHRRSPALHLTSFMRFRLPGSIQRLGSSWCMELENLNSQQAPAGHQVLFPLPSQSLQGKDGTSWGEQNPKCLPCSAPPCLPPPSHRISPQLPLVWPGLCPGPEGRCVPPEHLPNLPPPGQDKVEGYWPGPGLRLQETQSQLSELCSHLYLGRLSSCSF